MQLALVITVLKLCGVPDIVLYEGFLDSRAMLPDAMISTPCKFQMSGVVYDSHPTFLAHVIEILVG